MEGGSWRPAGQGDTGGDPPAGDWRSQLQPESRQRIVNKIMETLQRHLPIPASEGLTELKKIAVRFEEKIYTAATSQTDYLRKISLKMLSMETKAQNPQAINPSSMNPAVGNQSNVDAASLDSTGQTGNVGVVDWQEEIYQKQQQIKLQIQQQHLMQSQLMKQLQQCHIQQQMFQQQQKQQMLQRQQQHQQPAVQQQLLQQQKQQQNTQLPVHQMSQLNQMNEEMKMRQGAGIKPGLYQQHFQANQRHTYFHPQLKTGASFPISSPQNIQASSPQISQHSSRQVDQHGLLSSLLKTGTPLQSASSPFVVPSPSTPIALSPITTDSEKPLSGITSIPSTVNMGHQQTTLTPSQPQSIAVGTPGISASPLLVEFTNSEANQPNTSVFSGKLSATELPLERFIKVMTVYADFSFDVASHCVPCRPSPLICKPLSSSFDDASRCVEWLDSHRPGTVLYVSFGSQNSINASQMMELAAGLEESGEAFIWVIRPPFGFVNVRGEFKPEWLPAGFEERMREKKQGLLVHGWAPQVDILAHGSTAAFLSHCGWNSVLESLSHGVPIIGWPLGGDQMYNSKFLEEKVGVCLELARGNREDMMSAKVERQGVKKVVEMVMGGTEKGVEMKKKAMEISEMIRASTEVNNDFMGSSIQGLEEFFSAFLS